MEYQSALSERARKIRVAKWSGLPGIQLGMHRRARAIITASCGWACRTVVQRYKLETRPDSAGRAAVFKRGRLMASPMDRVAPG